jgi:hypothetical protein
VAPLKVRGVLVVMAFTLVTGSACSSARVTAGDPQAAASPSPTPTATKEPKVNNKRLIQRVWKQYAHAVRFRDAKDAVELVEHATINYFDEIRFAASNAGPKQIHRMPVADQLFIGALRLRYKPDKLLRMDARDIMAYSLEESLSTLSLRVSRLKLQNVKVDAEDGRAFGNFKVKGQKEKLRLDFLRESGEWKIDFLPVIRATSSYLIVTANEQSVGIDELILRILEVGTGHTVDASIWELPEG